MKFALSWLKTFLETDAGIFLLDQAVKFVSGKMFAGFKESAQDGIALFGLLQTHPSKMLKEDGLGLANTLARDAGFVVDAILKRGRHSDGRTDSLRQHHDTGRKEIPPSQPASETTRRGPSKKPARKTILAGSCDTTTSDQLEGKVNASNRSVSAGPFVGTYGLPAAVTGFGKLSRLRGLMVPIFQFRSMNLSIET